MITRESPGRTRLLASGLLALTFALGALAGAATDRAISADDDSPAHRQQGASRENRDNQRNTRRQPSVFFTPGIFDSLSTTPEQKQAIEAILDRRDREANALFTQIRPSLEAMRKQTWGEMKAQLTPEQLVKLERIISDRRESWQKERQQHQDNNKPRP